MQLDSYRAPGWPALAASVLLGAVILLDLVDAAVSLAVRSEYQQLVGGPESLTGTTVGSEAVQRAIYSLRLTVFVACGLVFIGWLIRIRRNADLLAPTAGHVRRAGWASWGWLVPVVSLWFPYQIVRDCWRASRSQDGERASEWLIRVWWAGWLVVSLVGEADPQLFIGAETPEGYATGFGLTAMGDVLDVVVAVLAILVVRGLTTMQVARAAEARAVPVGVPLG